ncbi:hypothetical protein Vretimale_4473 [Volvox reticuliferus]|uniref:Tubulin/FtsZ 2-layer sandwich domain-containing protein n=1 Tax=Volvox reticuliferus TaxID=1737510 RepID=A0A8J4C041_9CHLO|nr:hypothetical protein Vretifemale_3075 [Volvox reticuliferus]GIL99248.1 hypothetical protein Vretimale_4473 [Volvox reticuliferus]
MQLTLVQLVLESQPAPLQFNAANLMQFAYATRQGKLYSAEGNACIWYHPPTCLATRGVSAGDRVSCLSCLTPPTAERKVFGEVFSRDHQLIRADPRNATYLACGLIARGPTATIADINRNVARLRPQLRMVHWNSEGFKLGICSTPPVGCPFGLLCLANNTAIASTFTTMKERFDKLYRRRFYTHHYEQYMDRSGFESAMELVADLTHQYQELNGATRAPAITRLRPRGLSFLP